MGDLVESDHKEIYYFNVLNIISCIGVIMLHCNGVFWTHPNGDLWINSNIIETVMYFPVPIFFMLTGATLLEYRNKYSTKIYFKKRFMKTVIPFLIWSCISTVAVFYLSFMKNTGFDYNITKIFSNIINTKYNPVYWFFIPLFSIYLSIPIISLIPKKKNVYLYIILYGLITISVLPTIFKLFNIEFNDAIKAPMVGGYILYVFLGYFLANFEISRKQRHLIYLLSIIGLAIHFFGVLILTPENGPINKTFKGYLNFPCVLYSIGVFVFFKYLNYDKLKNLISEIQLSKISKQSFGIYLIHIFYLKFFQIFLHVNVKSHIWIICGAFLIYPIALFTVVVIKKIPVLKNIMP